MLLIAGTAVSARAQTARQFGAAVFATPPDWTLETSPTRQTLTLVRGANLCMIALYAADGLPSLERAFADAWASVFQASAYASAPRPAPVEAVTPGGYRHLAGENEIVDRAGNRFVARLHVFPAGARSQTIVVVGNSRAALDVCRADRDTFFTTLSFPSVAKVAAAGALSPADATTRPDGTSSVAAAVSDGSSMTIGNVSFAPPAGWIVERTSDGVTMKPADLRGPENLQVVLLPGIRTNSGLERVLADTWASIITGLGAEAMVTVNRTAFDMDEPGRSARGWNYLRGTGGIRAGGKTRAMDVYVLQAGDRVQPVAVIADDFRDNLTITNASLNPRYARAIQRFVFTIGLGNAASPAPARPSIRGDAIAGVWAGLALSFGRLKPHVAIFFSDGTAWFAPSFPQRGLLDIDPSVEEPRARRYWGSWSFRNGSGVLNAPSASIPLLLDGQSLQLTVNNTKHRFARMTVPDPRMLTGNWCLDDGHCLRLSDDGRFDDSGAVRVLEHATYPFPESPTAGRGRFRIRDHTLTLEYDGGAVLDMALVGSPGAGPPSELYAGFNLDLLKRR